MSLQSFRQAVQDTLESALQIEMRAGILTGPFERGDIGCCWSEGIRQRANVAEEELIVHARVFKQWRQEDPALTADPGPLEDLAESVQTALKPIQVSAGPWLFQLSEIEINSDEYYVEATIVGIQNNLFAQGG